MKLSCFVFCNLLKITLSSGQNKPKSKKNGQQKSWIRRSFFGRTVAQKRTSDRRLGCQARRSHKTEKIKNLCETYFSLKDCFYEKGTAA